MDGQQAKVKTIPVVERRESGHWVQSESQNACSDRSTFCVVSEEKVGPQSWVARRYRRKRWAAAARRAVGCWTCRPKISTIKEMEGCMVTAKWRKLQTRILYWDISKRRGSSCWREAKSWPSRCGVGDRYSLVGCAGPRRPGYLWSWIS
jgi:hypothetical protein